jgi:hypothetical protein
VISETLGSGVTSKDLHELFQAETIKVRIEGGNFQTNSDPIGHSPDVGNKSPLCNIPVLLVISGCHSEGLFSYNQAVLTPWNIETNERTEELL